MADLQPFIVNLPTATIDALKERRREVGVPMSETIRRALNAYLAESAPAAS